MWISIVECSILLIALIVTLHKVCTYTRFTFLTMLISLYLITDVATIILSIGIYYEHTQFSENYRYLLSVTIGVATFLFNFGTNTVLWLFSFKYWVISREVPKLFDGSQVVRDERIYTVFKILGLIANFTVCALFAFFRAKISFQTNHKEEKPK